MGLTSAGLNAARRIGQGPLVLVGADWRLGWPRRVFFSLVFVLDNRLISALHSAFSSYNLCGGGGGECEALRCA